MSSRFDYENQVCEDQAFTGAATVSEDAIKKVSAAQNLTIGRRISAVCYPKVNQGAGSTMKIEVVQADNAALTSNLEVLATLDGLTSKVVGDEIEVPVPQDVAMDKQYLGIRVTLTSGTTTITLDAYIVPQDEIPKYQSFPKAVTSLA